MLTDNIIVVAECNQGQPKDGVQYGGKFICENLQLNPTEIMANSLFQDIETQQNNGYEQLSISLHNYFKTKESKKITILIGGDHSLGISSVDSYLNIFKEELSVLWIDAHADINDHLTSITGNLHGMTLGVRMSSFRTGQPPDRSGDQKSVV